MHWPFVQAVSVACELSDPPEPAIALLVALGKSSPRNHSEAQSLDPVANAELRGLHLSSVSFVARCSFRQACALIVRKASRAFAREATCAFVLREVIEMV